MFHKLFCMTINDEEWVLGRTKSFYKYLLHISHPQPSIILSLTGAKFSEPEINLFNLCKVFHHDFEWEFLWKKTSRKLIWSNQDHELPIWKGQLCKQVFCCMHNLIWPIKLIFQIYSRYFVCMRTDNHIQT